MLFNASRRARSADDLTEASCFIHLQVVASDYLLLNPVVTVVKISLRLLPI